MEIVAEKKEKNYSKSFVCDYCGRTVQITLADLYWISDGEERETGATHHEVVFKCVCRRRNWLNGKIPEWVKQEVFRKRKEKRS